MASASEITEIEKSLSFKALCQDSACHAFLGGFHVPVVGGVVLFICPKCKKKSIFRNDAWEVKKILLGP
jgi:predicted RNA-binding Zn-ribbon protein involved in translation (DUF1610 family)